MSAEARAVTPSAEFDCAVCGAQLDHLHLDAAVDGARCSFCGALQDARLVAAGARPVSSERSVAVGETLRTGRLARGETLEQAARFTRIRTSYLHDLEKGDASAFEPYPGSAYARFFLREYADHLGLDPAPLVRRFDTSAAPTETPPVALAPPPRPVRNRRWAFGAAIVLATALIGGAWLSRGADDRGNTPMTSSVTGGVATAHPLDRPRPVPPGSGSPLLAVITTTRDCWILASEDGEIVLQETVPAGQTLTLRASRTLDLRLGDAGAANLVVNGRPISTGGPGDVADLSLAWRDGTLVRS